MVAEYSGEENGSKEKPANLLVKEKKVIKMVVEIKKSIGKAMLFLGPSDVIELFIYCLYTLRSNKQDTIKDVLNDRLNWHCPPIKRVVIETQNYIMQQREGGNWNFTIFAVLIIIVPFWLVYHT